MNKKKLAKLEVLKKGTKVTQIHSEEDLQRIAAGLRPVSPGIGCGGPNECLA
jgi:hypothetical protein